MDMKTASEIAGLLAEASSKHLGLVVVTVVANRSPYPVVTSSRMAVFADGEVRGSLHPDLNAVFAARAISCLEERKSQLRSFNTQVDPIAEVGVAGGDFEVFFEVLPPAPVLVIVGAGHIAVPLARLAALAEFRVVIVDDRPEYASPDRFPDASTLLVGPYRSTLAQVPIDPDTFIVLVTRGHVHDRACLEQVLNSPAAYIGMIGSRRRVRTVMQHAAENGSDPNLLRRVFAPIGLDIGAQTPAEIAIAIMGEIINLRRGGNARSLAIGERLDV